VTWLTHALTHLDDDRSHGVEGEGGGEQNEGDGSSATQSTHLLDFRRMTDSNERLHSDTHNNFIVCKILEQRLMLTFSTLRLMELCVFSKREQYWSSICKLDADQSNLRDCPQKERAYETSSKQILLVNCYVNLASSSFGVFRRSCLSSLLTFISV